MPISTYVRSLVNHVVPRGQPSDDLFSLIYYLSKISNNIDKIVEIAGETGNVNIIAFKSYKKELNKILYEVKEKYIGADPIDIFGNPIKK